MTKHHDALPLAQLLVGLTAPQVAGNATLPIKSIAFDSRECEPGSLFVALRGGYTDGHAFLRQARDSGAVAALVQSEGSVEALAGYEAVVRVTDTRAALAVVAANFYRHPSRSMTLVGVTGTDGKTTTSHMIDAICRTAGRRTGLIGTVEVRIGDEIDRHESRQTTPESLIVQAYLSRMHEYGTDIAILEATSHGLAMHRLDGCAFDVGVITNITHEHLDFHGSIERYRAAKGLLLRNVSESRAVGKLGVAVVNLDDLGAREIEHFAEGSTLWHYSMETAAPVRASAIKATYTTTFDLTTPTGTETVHLNLPGRYNVANALAAAGAGHALGLTVQEIGRGLESLRSVPGRMEVVDEGQPFQVIVDYAHTPEALRQALSEARRFGTGRLMVVFGSGGERDIEKRSVQGAVAQDLADFAVFTSEDPRFENPDAIIDDIAAGARGAGAIRGVHFECIEDRRAAILALIERAQPGDVLVLAGKGHEHSMIYGDERRPWSDSDVAREALRTVGYTHEHTPAGSTA